MNVSPDPDDLDEFDAFFDDRRLLRPPKLWSHRKRLAHRPVERSDLTISVALFGLSLAALVAMRATSLELQSEIAGSLWFRPTQLGAIASVTIASAVRPFAGRSLLWTTLAIGPWMTVILIEGYVLFDPMRGAWLGAVYLVLLTGVAAACLVSGTVAAHLRQPHRTGRGDAR